MTEAAAAAAGAAGGKGVALVTGASSGIGSALARVLAKEGYAVGLVARRAKRLHALRAEIETDGGRAVVHVADVADRAAVQRAVEAIARALGPIDLLVANAGISVPTDALAPDGAGFEHEVRVNLLGVFHAIEAVVPAMRERGRGHVVAISSLAAWRGLPGAAGYCATKAALLRLMESLRLDWKGAGIRATTVLPGFVESEITAARRHPMPFLLSGDAAARKIVRAIRRGRRTYAFPWPTVLLAWIGRLLPDAVLRRTNGREPSSS